MTVEELGRSARSGRRARVAAWLVAAFFIAVGATALLPPSPVPASAPADRFSAERAMEHVRVIGRTLHPMGTRAAAEVRANIVGCCAPRHSACF